MTTQAIDTWWQLVKIYASWQMPKSGNFWRKHFWTENKPGKFWESPSHVALATHGCARGRMEIKFQLCARKHIFYLLYLQQVEKVEPQWQKTRHGAKTGFVCSSRRSTFCSQCTAHSHSAQWTVHSHSGAQTDTAVAQRSSPPWVVWKTVTNVKEASFVWTQSSSKLSHTSCV